MVHQLPRRSLKEDEETTSSITAAMPIVGPSVWRRCGFVTTRPRQAMRSAASGTGGERKAGQTTAAATPTQRRGRRSEGGEVVGGQEVHLLEQQLEAARAAENRLMETLVHDRLLRVLRQQRRQKHTSHDRPYSDDAAYSSSCTTGAAAGSSRGVGGGGLNHDSAERAAVHMGSSGKMPLPMGSEDGSTAVGGDAKGGEREDFGGEEEEEDVLGMPLWATVIMLAGVSLLRLHASYRHRQPPLLDTEAWYRPRGGRG
eukprot:GHVU01084440.1.p1 GENE.GHVU01084440.1~~GHVU01084440.1.p1  ORF type:complete len:257 (+),score=53.42 GHVU01084440.1:612-1382(+)